MTVANQSAIVRLSSKHPLLSLSFELAELCKPLELLRVNHFTYMKQFNDGSRISLSTKPEWVENYYNLGLYQSSLFEDKPAKYEPTFNVWVGDYDLEVYKYGRQHYDTADCISITEPHHDGCAHYFFSASPEHYLAIQYLANNMNILYYFIMYLKDRGEKLFKNALKSRIIIPNIPPNKSILNSSDDKAFYTQMQSVKKMFRHRIPIHKYIFEGGENRGIKLTQREIGCVIHLLQNKTAPETAKLMNLSSRTVEYYLNNIKNKLNCDTKIELINKLKADKYLLALLDF